MNKNKKQLFLILNFVLLLLLVSFSAWKEEGYKKGEYYYLQLSPIDPRSLLQGDYMTLNYDIVDRAMEKIITLEEKEKRGIKKGYIVVSPDEKRVLHYKDVVEKTFPSKDLLFIAFHSDGFTMKINADSFLFQEGKADLYQESRYSKVALIDHHLRLLDLVKEIQ